MLLSRPSTAAPPTTTSPTITTDIPYPKSPREVSGLRLVLREDQKDRRADNNSILKTATALPDMCRPTPAASCNDPPDLTLPPPALPVKPSLRRLPSPKSVASTAAKKRVRFALVAPVKNDDAVVENVSSADPPPKDSHPVLTTVHPTPLPPSSQMSPDEKADIWWQPHDYDVFSGTARLISGEIRRRAAAMSAAASRQIARGGGGKGSGGGESNLRAYAESYSNILTCSLQECSSASTTEEVGENPISADLFRYLAHWTRSGHSRRGLERWSVAYHGERRHSDREGQVRAVLAAQEELKAAEKDGMAAMVTNKHEQQETIRRASEIGSRTARLFALALGHADAAAVGCHDPVAAYRDSKDPSI